LVGHGNWGFVGGVLQKQVLTNVLIGAEVYHQTSLQVDFPNDGTAFNVGTVIDFKRSATICFSPPAAPSTARRNSNATSPINSPSTTALFQK